MTIRLVIAEDHRVVAEALATMLGFDGDFEVVAITGSGTEVLELVHEHKPDVVLMDVGLEGLNGIEATRRLRAENGVTQVVILTMHDDEATVTDAVAAGALGFLPKNVQRAELETAVRAVAAGEGFLHPSVTSRFLRKMAPLVVDSLGPERLTDREVDVLERLAEGLSTRQIAERLILGEETVKSHLAHIYQKLGVNDRVQAVALAIRRGLVR